MRALVTAAVLAAALVVPVGTAAPAAAAARVTVANGDGDAAVDPTYATTVTVSGAGFQSVRGGHGGIYVFFGTVRDGWRPSQGGQTGRDYLYVPDSESQDNQGHQRYLAFPGSDTAGSANGTLGADGTWSTTLNVPGAVFQAVDREGRATTVDCRRVTCGVITVGAHGVVNATNETFTPVRVEELYAGEPAPTAAPTAPTAAAPSAAPAPAQPQGRGKRRDRPAAAPAPALDVDRASAHPGHVLAFAATGLVPGGQVSAVLDDGVAGAGPFLVGPDGGVSGVLNLPADTAPGTHELRLYGGAAAPAVSFAVTAAAPPAQTVEPVATVRADGGADRLGLGFAAASALVLLLALARLVRVRRGARRG